VEHLCNDTKVGKSKYAETKLSTTNPTRTSLLKNSSIRAGSPATNL
jgi:hypothetical protein